MDISKKLRASCRQARARYHNHLQEQEEAKQKRSSEAAKEIITLEIEEVQRKKTALFDFGLRAHHRPEKSKNILAEIAEANSSKR